MNRSTSAQVRATQSAATLAGVASASRDRPAAGLDVAGLVAAPVIASLLGKAAIADIQAGWSEILVAGFLVGIGTRYASGCTSGHGVCGLSRFSPRSFVAVVTFMGTAAGTVFLIRHALPGGSP